jgi:hypothetical protein
MIPSNDNVTEGKMTTEDRMTIDERYKYLRKMKSRYVNANRKERGRLLDEMQAVTGLHRKSLTRLLQGNLERKPRCKQRGRTYDAEVLAAVGVISASLDHPCAERLTPNLVWMAEHLAAHQELEVRTAVREKLKRISISTVERYLRTMGQKRTRRSRKPPRAPNAALRGIPMGRIPWNTTEPGHLEADTVHHCGESASGEYIHTVQMVDVATGWSERRATLGRSYLVMKDAFRHIVNQTLSRSAQCTRTLDSIFSLPCRTADHTEVVFDTLSEIPDPRLQMALAPVTLSSDGMSTLR